MPTSDNYSNYYCFQVIVQEINTANQRSSTVTLTINVQNANDNPPVFPASAYEVSFLEGTYQFDGFNNQPRDLLTVTATDADSGQFGAITYSITSVSNNGADLFNIGPGSGLIQADGSFAGNTSYTITVQASDGKW